MERRIERVLAYVQEQVDASGELCSVTTAEVAEALGIQRTNSSKDLNQLVREGLIIKSQQRPVKYQAIKPNIYQPLTKYVPSYKENAETQTEDAFNKTDKNIFAHLIGTNGSMKNAVEQAKAAILYPPKGLNCLITGPTGSGKTHFAHAMFTFAKENGVIHNHQELTVFNCADYANNPELLMSHLFGYVKGAFTGAENDKAGIIDQADGGMLFLDEIHRLSPEGQEMIFYFMDHGTYNRLGESGKHRQADVRIVGATTEDPSSSLLDTFVRRIPIHIQLPAFTDRPALEQIDLVRMLLAIEANRIQRHLVVTEDVAKALIGSVTYGNIGQLKSNIQLVCARAFMNQMTSTEILISVDDLSENIKTGLVQLASQREWMAEITKNLEPKLLIPPNEPFLKFQQDTYELPYNLYDIIGDKAALLKADGLDQSSINHFISTDINIHLKSFYKDHGFTFEADNKLVEFVDGKIIHLTEEIFEYVNTELNYVFQPNFIYAMSLHISSFVRKITIGEKREANINIQEMAEDFPVEFTLATEIHKIIGQRLEMTIPKSEVYYLTVLLVSLQNRQKSGRVGVVLAAHGNSTATSMAQVVQTLLNTKRVQGVDMPLDMSPQVAFEKIKEKVKQLNEGNGVLLLVDMGSLTSFAEKIATETGIAVRTLDMVTTPLVLEAVRKASVLGTNLEELYDSLKNFQGYASFQQTKEIPAQQSQKEKVILAICASGEGTAQKIKEIIEGTLLNSQIKDLAVMTTSVLESKEKIQKLQADSEKELIAVTGILDPQIDVPFLSLEQFINQDIETLLEDLLLENDLSAVAPIELTEESAKQLCTDYMTENFTFINGKKLVEPLWGFTQQLFNDYFAEEMPYSTCINLVVHLAGAVERVILRSELHIEDHELDALYHASAYQIIHPLTEKLAQWIQVQLPAVEEYFIYQFLENQKVTE
ncbi:transcriptional regulatory protein LevR/transcriptional regulator with AAA-type ATPase domain [Enterococcus sp. PF1-24]|uniref:sigma-54-dependent transcriptional regulator n=1 Tax=unclassified Enterococcus TaxID=2608891 RepID=UPI002476DF41|nr:MULTISPECIES: sigma-54-dependent transcriptional regulator [unclassified Enterococcus]MDH6364413.1 transcriptional regulatory protein LevR/transcriptional regulator with AAA-type ATPase domain [Enterococcus sp. PFB1-1]MDH6401564.1 transcriptional regulatory protein LevR/transcriptional regulator with AAA-type ATPase domain [Enterococcus sp. PF1-24]